MSAINIGAAYTGFMNSGLLTLQVNSGKHIQLAPGTYSAPVSISAGTSLQAVSIKIIAEDVNNQVLQFDYPEYYVFSYAPEEWFRVGASISTSPGFYFITWTITETPLVSGTDMYAAPRKSIVEVYSNAAISISIGAISNIPIGGVGLPILLSIAGGVSPYSDVSIIFATTTANADVTFYPATFNFTSMNSVGAFAIGYNGTATTGTSISYTYTLSGTDMSAFTITSGGSFTLGAIATTPASISSLTLIASSQINATITITLGSISVVTWAFGATAMFDLFPDLATYDVIAATAFPVYGTADSNQTMLSSQIMAYESSLNNLNPATLGWKAYSLAVLVLAQLNYLPKLPGFRGEHSGIVW